MLCGSKEVADRIERVETQMITSATGAARRRGRDDAFVIPIAGGAACYAEDGCDIATVTTQPGSKSQQNVQRRGFHLLCTRAVLVKPLS
jgi:hypothetical protein